MMEGESSKGNVSKEAIAPNRPTIEELKAQKIAAIEARIQSLHAEIASMTSKLEAVNGDLKSPPANTIKTHISLLHRYNDIKDIGQMLIGLVVEARNRDASYADRSTRGAESAGGEGRAGNTIRVRDIMEELGLRDAD